MIKQIYPKLLNSFKSQGWWPLTVGSIVKHHAGPPETDTQRLEICLGAILTQNTNWKNVEKALTNLNRINALNLKGIKRISDGKLKESIKCAGYYNNKAKKIRIFVDFFSKLNGKTPTREELLNVWGIGEETADSMLLYAFNVPVFVVDAYTRRILIRMGLIDKKAYYGQIQKLFMDNLEHDAKMFNEYHALLVELGKNYCKTRNPLCSECPLNDSCKKLY